jgi:transcriptional regulator with XRE-family HTH domain
MRDRSCEVNANGAGVRLGHGAEEAVPRGPKNRKPTPESLALLSYNVKRLRRALGITQIELAQRSNMGQGYIGDIERDAVNATIGCLEALAVGLECGLADLFMPPSFAAERGGRVGAPVRICFAEREDVASNGGVSGGAARLQEVIST